MVCYHCGGRHHVRECVDASETMRARLMAIHRTGGIRRDNRVDTGGGAAAASARCPFGDMSMSESSGGERKSGDGYQDEPTDPEMPRLTEDPLPPGGGDPRQEEAEDTGTPMQQGRRYLGWTPQGGHIYEQPRGEREDTSPGRRTLDASAAPWQPPLPPSSPRSWPERFSSIDDVRQAMGYPRYSRVCGPRDASGDALRESTTEEDDVGTRGSSGAEKDAAGN